MNDFDAPGSTAVLLPEESFDVAAAIVELSDGTIQRLVDMSDDELAALQWREERIFARRIADAPRHSRERAEAFRQGYDTICTIHAVRAALRRSGDGEPLQMGFDRRYSQLVLQLLAGVHRRGVAQPRLFEVGYGAGVLLKQVRDAGYDFAGIEVSPAMQRAAAETLGAPDAPGLLVGDFMATDLEAMAGTCHVVYWNDVFEHIPTDEIEDYVRKIHRLLAPGGKLVTITPNWHMRPSDVTRSYLPPRSEPVGFHLREYTLRDVSAILKAAGFSSVATPLIVTKRRIHLCGNGLAGLKRACEPLLERLPYRVARLLCRGFGLSCTIATKID